jgi:hypothetical protein
MCDIKPADSPATLHICEERWSEVFGAIYWTAPLGIPMEQRHPLLFALATDKNRIGRDLPLTEANIADPPLTDGHFDLDKWMQQRPRRVILVSCVAGKHSQAARAKELYTSPWFQKARAYAEREIREWRAESWWILSAQYRLVSPDRVIEPYNRSLNDMDRDHLESWANLTARELDTVINRPEEVEFVFFAGVRYRKVARYLLPYKSSVPLSNLGIGLQMQWFDRQMKGADHAA